jgi:cell division protein FtsB
MKSIIIALSMLFLCLQYQLWFAKGGFLTTWHQRHELVLQQKINLDQKRRNDHVLGEIQDLKHGQEALEDHARKDLGMIKKNETFYQVVKPGHRSAS